MASTLQKIFIRVPEAKCDAFINKYVRPTSGSRDTSYDAKIVFLEKSQEVFTQGKVYGLNNTADVAALTEYIGTMPTKANGEPYANIVEYIQDAKEAAISGITVGTNNSVTVSGTVYTLHVNNGEITLDPYTALAIPSLSFQNSNSETLSNQTKEFDTTVSMTIAKILYSFSGTENCKYLSIQVGNTYVVGTGSTKDKMESVDLAPNTTYTKELESEEQVTIESTTGSDAITVNIWAMDSAQTSPVKKSVTLSISHQRVYLVGHEQPTAESFASYSSRTLGNKPASITFTADASKYGWFAYPASWGTPSMKDKDTGLGMTMAEDSSWNLSDMYSDNITYKVYRTGQFCGKTQTINLTW